MRGPAALLRLLPLVGLLWIASPPGPEARAGERAGPHHENPRWGYKVRAPVGWERRAIHIEEAWIADKFFPDAPLRARGPGGDFREHVPSLWVVGFPHARTEGAGTRVEKVGENTLRITVENPYRDYLDFVKREEWAAVGQGGWFVSRDESAVHDDHEVRVVEIKVEKLVAAPLRVVAWIYRCQDVDFAVQITILEDAYEENRAALEHCLRSFREIPRTEPFPDTSVPGPIPKEAEASGLERSPEEIYLERVERIEERIAAEVDRLPKGWIGLTSKHFVCLSQIDKQHTRYVLNFAEEIRDYLDENFEDVGEDRIPPGLIRVFATTADEQAYLQGTRHWWTDEVGEVTLTFGRDAAILAEFSGLARRLTDQYFHIKNENLKNGMPGWLRAGIWGHIAWARPSKRKKMVMAPTPQTVRSLALLFAQDKQLTLFDLMTRATEEFDPGHREQAESVVYWLLGRGNRGAAKDALKNYLLALEGIVREEDRRFEIEEEKRWQAEQASAAARRAADAGKSQEELEEEEDARYRQRRANLGAYGQRLAGKWAAIRERAVNEAFGQLDEKDWQKLDKAWERFAKP